MTAKPVASMLTACRLVSQSLLVLLVEALKIKLSSVLIKKWFWVAKTFSLRTSSSLGGQWGRWGWEAQVRLRLSLEPKLVFGVKLEAYTRAFGCVRNGLKCLFLCPACYHRVAVINSKRSQIRHFFDLQCLGCTINNRNFGDKCGRFSEGAWDLGGRNV